MRNQGLIEFNTNAGKGQKIEWGGFFKLEAKTAHQGFSFNFMGV